MENSLSILIADENKDQALSLKSFMETDEKVKNVETANDGEDTLNKIISNSFDVVILDAVLSKLDGFEVLEEAKNQGVKTRFIMLSSLSSDTFIQKAMNLGVEYYMVKPTAEKVVFKRVLDLFETKAVKELESQETEVENKVAVKSTRNKLLEEKITNIFITVGIPAHIKGYYFLREAIKMAIENPEVINSITKQLYPSIAERFDTSASKVERAIRHAIEVAWNRGKIENINSVFGVKVYSNNEKPTNGEFIALVADKMLIEG